MMMVPTPSSDRQWTAQYQFGKRRFDGADLGEADLSGASLHASELARAGLSGASLTDEQLAPAKSLEGATLPDGTKHD